MASEKRDWKEQAIAKFEKQLEEIEDRLGERASIAEIERVLVEHENSIMRGMLEAFREGISPPRDEGDA